MSDIKNLTTEEENLKTQDMDNITVHNFLQIMNSEDAKVAFCVKKQLGEIENAVNLIVNSLKKGGKLYYIGSGTSGRLGILDAVECPPTFGTTDEITGIIAGGDNAFIKAREGVEDDFNLGKNDIDNYNISDRDVVVGIAASGRTPYTIGALERAKEIGAKTISLSCNKNSKISTIADISIEIDVGPEVLSGSTRLKAGTAQKMVLNMLSTTTMKELGKTYKNYMVDMKATNKKLIERSKNIICKVTGCNISKAEQALIDSNYDTKLAIAVVLLNSNVSDAKKKLDEADGIVKNIVNDYVQ